MMGKHPKRFNASTLVVTTARLRTKTGCFNIGGTNTLNLRRSKMSYLWILQMSYPWILLRTLK